MTPGTSRPVRGVFCDVGDTLVHHTASMPAVLAREAASVGITIEGERLITVETVVRARLAERAANGRPFSFPAGESRRFWTSIYVAVLGERLSVASSSEIAERVYAHFSSPVRMGCIPMSCPPCVNCARWAFGWGSSRTGSRGSGN